MKYTPIAPSTHQALRAALLGHYDRAARDLPWRKDTDPYRVLVSEIMLQQTRVETVKGYYDPWLERFPSIGALASADEDDVLKAWEGLGYYRRARNLHRAARVVREDHEGVLPVSYAELRGLPGVGEYTAGAVASIAFGERVPAVDGNVRRVFARLFDVSEPKPAWLRETAGELVDEHRPGDWNQALMELGATVCTPRSPKCEICPVARWCAAIDAGTVAERPTAAKRRVVPSRKIGLLVLHSEGRVLLEKREDGGLLGGMWAFPETGDPAGDPAGDSEGISEANSEAGAAPAPTQEGTAPRLPDALGLAIGRIGTVLPEVRHRFTHLDALYRPVAIEVTGSERAVPSGYRWVGPREADEIALPVAQRKVFDSWLHQLSTEAV